MYKDKNMSTSTEKDTIPKWNLNDLYKGMQVPELLNDLNEAKVSAEAFASMYKGKLLKINKKKFYQSIEDYEELSEALAKIMSYAQLLFSADSENGHIANFYQDISERITEISSITLFYELEINRIDDALSLIHI